jgi:hypothetical protein
VPTLAEAQAHQQAITDLTTLAQAELVATWRAVDLANPVEVAEAARDVVPALAVAYSLAGATLAADFYETLRDSAGVAGSFVASLADEVAPERVDALLGWGLEPLFRRDEAESELLAEEHGVKVEPRPAPDPNAALSRLSGGLQRIVANADRDTIAANAERDPAGARWARHASADACAFCRLLATRDAVYRSQTDALRVTKASNKKRPLGEKYHDDCRCAAIPEWPDAPLERAPYVDDWEAAYTAATSDLGGAHDPKALLAHMRESMQIAH